MKGQMAAWAKGCMLRSGCCRYVILTCFVGPLLCAQAPALSYVASGAAGQAGPAHRRAEVLQLGLTSRRTSATPCQRTKRGKNWHAQNKLSLTVFGCNVSTAGRPDTNFLLLSKVLDHDSQMALLLITRVRETVAANLAYEWSKVKMLHLVCDWSSLPES